MFLRKQAHGYCAEVKRNGKRFYKGGFKTKKAAKEWATSKEK